MSERRRGYCPECGRSCAITASGRIWAHRELIWNKTATDEVCAGTGRLPLPGRPQGTRR